MPLALRALRRLFLLAATLAGCGGKLAAPSVETSSVARAQLALGDSFGCAVRAGEVWCWGSDRQGGRGDCQDGAPCFPGSQPPRRVPGVTNVVGISAIGSQACAVHGDGGITCWGQAVDGMSDCIALGFTCAIPPTPIAVGGAAQVAAGGRPSCAIRHDGSVACWGEGNLLGSEDGAPTTSLTPQPLALALPAVQVSTSIGGACVLTLDGAVSCWGYHSAPVRVSGFDDAVEITTGGSATCARRRDGSVWCKGYASYDAFPGAAYDPGFQPSVSPIPGLHHAVAIRTSTYVRSFFAVRRDGSVMHWGECRSGSCADGATSLDALTTLTSIDHLPRVLPALAGTRELVTNGTTTCVLGFDDRVRCAGEEVGDGRYDPHASLVEVAFE